MKNFLKLSAVITVCVLSLLFFSSCRDKNKKIMKQITERMFEDSLEQYAQKWCELDFDKYFVTACSIDGETELQNIVDNKGKYGSCTFLIQLEKKENKQADKQEKKRVKQEKKKQKLEEKKEKKEKKGKKTHRIDNKIENKEEKINQLEEKKEKKTKTGFVLIKVSGIILITPEGSLDFRGNGHEYTEINIQGYQGRIKQGEFYIDKAMKNLDIEIDGSDIKIKKKNK